MRDKGSRLIDVALGKPVVYLETQIERDGKTLDQRYNYERYSVNEGRYPGRLTDGSMELWPSNL